MSNQIFSDDYYNNKVIIEIESVTPHRALLQVPDSVKDEIINALCESRFSGKFKDEDCMEYDDSVEGGRILYTGSWHVVQLDYTLMLSLAMWSANRYVSESFSEKMFVEYFGESYGKHYYSKWIGELNCDYAKAFGYFRTRRDHGQIFCDMMMKQVTKYLKREPL